MFGIIRRNGYIDHLRESAVNEEETGDVFLIYARNSSKPNDISLFLVEKGMPGFSLGTKITDKLGMRVRSCDEFVGFFVHSGGFVAELLGWLRGSDSLPIKTLRQTT